MKVMRKGEIIEVREIEPGDIAILENDNVPVGHVVVITGPLVSQPESLFPEDMTDEDWEALNDDDWDD